MKYYFIAAAFFYFVLHDMLTLLKQIQLVRGIAYLLLLSALGIFFTAWLDIAKQHTRLRKKLGPEVYDWLEGNDE